jgi:putative tricarboxylic transport membrane protein
MECIAPANAGGGWDLTCRVTGRILTGTATVTGPVRTVNMPGAGGGVAFAHAVSRRRGDPSVLFAASPATTLRLAQRQYGPLRPTDVRWIGALGAEYGIIAVAADAPWQTLGSLMTDWRARPDSIVVSGGSAMVGQDHMKILLLAREAGIEPRRIRYVPFDGGGEALMALLGGFVDVFSGEASEVEAYLQTGAIRVLAVLAPEPLDGLLEGVPTARQSGFPVEWVTWRGFYLPPGLEEETYRIWQDRLDRVGRSEAWVQARSQARLRPFHLVGPAFEAFVLEQVASFEGLARELGLLNPSISDRSTP